MKNKSKFTVTALTVLAAVVFFPTGRSAPQTNGSVLILDSTVIGGANSREALAAIAAGKTVDVVTDMTWSSMTAAQFAAYDAIILGDPECAFSPPAAAANNAMVWGPVVNGNVVVIGTDASYHAPSFPGAQQLITSAVAFSVARSGRTGAYIMLSCYYASANPNTAVPMLAGLSTMGSFTVVGLQGHDDAHIVAYGPALTGLTDADLSNWGESIHEGFDHRPTDFIPLAIARDPAGGPPLPGSKPFPDGISGVPYILVRGEVAPVDFFLTPFTATNQVGTTHTVTATLEQGGTPLAGVTVTFTVTGANSTTGQGVTNASGIATFTYLGVNVGNDMIVAQYTDTMGHMFTSTNTVEKIWEPFCQYINGGFESGDFTGWVIDGHVNDPVVTNNDAHSGTYSAFAGGNPQQGTFCTEDNNEPLGDSSFYQEFTVPLGGGTLSFWHKDCSNDTITSDWQDAYITDTSGAILLPIFHLCDTADWTNQIVDLTGYAGQTVRIKFLVHQDGSNPPGDTTGMWVDDVSIAPTPTVTSAVSRKMHGAGPFDINLPLTGPAGIECRIGGGSAHNDYTMVVTFYCSVTAAGYNGGPQAQVTTAIAPGCVGANTICDPAGGVLSNGTGTITIPLTNIADGQCINVRLNNLNGTGVNVDIPMAVLLGDTTGNGAVNSSDVSQTKARIGPVDGTNFRSDVNPNGAINSTDVSLVKFKSGTQIQCP